MRMEPQEPLTTVIHGYLVKETAEANQHLNGFHVNNLVRDERDALTPLTSLMAHVNNAIPGARFSGDEKSQASPKLPKQEKQPPNTDIRKIFFSKNEKFMVLITDTQAIVYKLSAGKFDVKAQFDLPKTKDYSTVDRDQLRRVLGASKMDGPIDINDVSTSHLGSAAQTKQTEGQA